MPMWRAKNYQRHLSIVVISAVALHLVWAACLYFDATVVDVNAINALFRYIYPPRLLALTFVIAAAMALLGLFAQRPIFVLLLIPQQLLLVIAAAGAMDAMWVGQFATGTIRSTLFIVAAQFYSVLIAAGHTAAIILHTVRVWNDDAR